MIEIPTVLILGAGASIPYRYPSGEDLVVKILDSNGIEFIDFEKRNKQYTYPPDEFKEFQTALEKCGKGSVDSFLEHRPEFIDIGKMAITQELSSFENEKSLMAIKDPQNLGKWYRYLFNKMNSDFDDFGKNKLSIITFNYDRSLEHFLCTSLMNSFGKSDKESAIQLNHIPFIHLHGQMGYLPWQGKCKKLTRAYGDINNLRVRESAKLIRIIHDDIKDDDEFKQARKLISNAERIYFLGFGFNETNVERLGLNSLREEKSWKINGTCKKLTAQERMDVLHILSKHLREEDEAQARLRQLDARINLAEPSYHILNFFRNDVSL